MICQMPPILINGNLTKRAPRLSPFHAKDGHAAVHLTPVAVVSVLHEMLFAHFNCETPAPFPRPALCL